MATTSCPTRSCCESPRAAAVESGLVHSRFVNANHSQIARRIVSDRARRHATPICQCDLDALRVMHDMAVSKNQAIGSEYKPRASAAPFARLAGARAPGSLMHFNVHHRGADDLDRAGNCAGIGVEQGIVVGSGPRGRCRSRRRLLAPSIRFRMIHRRGVGRCGRKNTSNFFQAHAG